MLQMSVLQLLQKLPSRRLWRQKVRQASSSRGGGAGEPGAAGEGQENSLQPEIFQLLTETQIHVKSNKYKGKPISVWERICSYRGAYLEKSVLLDTETAERITKNVDIHSRADSNTKFFDGEGGLCRVAALAASLDRFSSVAVLEKDEGLSVLHEHAKNNYLNPDTEIIKYNYGQVCVQVLNDKTFESDLIAHLPAGNISEEIPSYTLVSTASHGFVKHFNERLLYRDNPFGEFYSSRPELFLIVNARTYFHLCGGYNELSPVEDRMTDQEMDFLMSSLNRNPQHFLYQNILFQILFRFCLIDVIPRQAYYPWKKFTMQSKTKSSLKKAGAVYAAHHDSLCLLYARPRTPEEVQIGNPRYFSHFLQRLLKNKQVRVVELLERWNGGWGVLVIDIGFTVFTKVNELQIGDMTTLYKVLIRTSDFEHSYFVEEAEITYRENNDYQVSDDEMESFKIHLSRKLSKGEDISNIYESFLSESNSLNSFEIDDDSIRDNEESAYQFAV